MLAQCVNYVTLDRSVDGAITLDKLYAMGDLNDLDTYEDDLYNGGAPDDISYEEIVFDFDEV